MERELTRGVVNIALPALPRQQFAHCGREAELWWLVCCNFLLSRSSSQRSSAIAAAVAVQMQQHPHSTLSLIPLMVNVCVGVSVRVVPTFAPILLDADPLP